MDDGKSSVPADAVPRAMHLSWITEMSSRLYFPRYGDSEGELRPGQIRAWNVADLVQPNREAIDELPSYESLTLFEAAVLIGERILGGPWKLIGKAPELFATELLRGAIDPRHPLSGLRFSDDPSEVPDLSWRLRREELQAFAMLRWNRKVYTDAEMGGCELLTGHGDQGTPAADIAKMPDRRMTEGEHCEAPADEHQAGADGNMTRRDRKAPTDRKLLEVVAALLALMPEKQWPCGKDLEKAAQSVGISISDDTCLKALRAAKELMTHPSPNPPK
jgi:hypothetical protein